MPTNQQGEAILAGDERWMAEAIALAKFAAKHQDVPIGAVVVLDGAIIGRGWNRREALHDPCGHAEVVAIREACRRVQRWRLDGASLYVTLEPCVMCAGALVNARMRRLVYGAADAKAGAAGSLFQVTQDARLNHQIETIGGCLEAACSELLRGFFAELRATRKQAPRRPEHRKS